MFSNEVVELAWIRSEGRCECDRGSHNHPNERCDNKLIWELRGKIKYGGWIAHSKIRNAGGASSNCEICCWDCFVKIQERFKKTN